eukprot:symbB.v1.2.016353.t1/scaffold1222.1/size194531/27
MLWRLVEQKVERREPGQFQGFRVQRCHGCARKARVWVHNCGEETQKLLRKEALQSSFHEDPAEHARAALEAQAATMRQVERPEALDHINEVSPVPDEVWKKAKAFSDNLL